MLQRQTDNGPLNNLQADKDLRHRCRNPNRRSKLPAPVSISRNAFCCRVCYTAFYRHRCYICEEVMERKSAAQRVCGKGKCRSALKARTVESRFESNFPDISKAPAVGGRSGDIDASICQIESNSPDISTLKSAIKTDRARVVAGPELSPSQFHCATVPDGPGGRWGGEFRRIEAKNKAALEAAGIEVDGGYFTEPDWQEVVSPDGVHCWVTRWRAAS
jgi:hypothetical protein